VALDDLGAVAVTAGPGLVGALLVGIAAAKAIAVARGLPLHAVDHLQGHVAANFAAPDPFEPPFVCLVASGGHTLLAVVEEGVRYRVAAKTMDDAAGEAFDKGARLLGLGYPGGKELDELAAHGDPGFARFPRAVPRGRGFSFSGLKTHTLNTVADCRGSGELSEQDRCDIARAFEDAVVATLVIKCRRALTQEALKTLVIAGGVSANTRLRAALEKALAKEGGRVFYPAPVFCTDNGAMIAYAGAQRLQAGQRDDADTRVRPRWPMEELPPLPGAEAT
jgi:N6-L-threonylcarbamoyladenine synthase